MADVELVIKMPQEIRLALINNIQLSIDQQSICDSCIKQAIINSSPLPKGHGRLGDLDKIWSELKELEEHYQAEFLKESNAIHESAMNGRLYGFTNSKFIVQDAPTIIPADRESRDADSD